MTTMALYNDWIAAFCSGSGGRLKAVAMVNVEDPVVAVAEGGYQFFALMDEPPLWPV